MVVHLGLQKAVQWADRLVQQKVAQMALQKALLKALLKAGHLVLWWADQKVQWWAALLGRRKVPLWVVLWALQWVGWKVVLLADPSVDKSVFHSAGY